MTNKVCRNCFKEKSLSEFTLRKSGYYERRCRSCLNAIARDRRKKFPQTLLESRVKSVKNRYKLTEEEYLKLSAKAAGHCQICGVSEETLTKSLHIDHCHTTGRVRGLLCHGCNVGLGHFKDSIELMEKATDYLKRGEDGG